MKNKILIFITCIIFSTSCDNYLDLVPEKDLVTIESIFQKRNSAYSFFAGCYRHYSNYGTYNNDPSYIGSDEITTGEYVRNKTFCKKEHYTSGLKISSGEQNTSNPVFSIWGGNKNYYEAIRDCNIFIENVGKVYNMTQEDKDKYTASTKAIKANYYFELMRRYGPICLVPKNISVEADIQEMLVKRSPIDTVVNTIVRLLDEAIPDLENFSTQPYLEYGFFNKEAAYVLKSKVLLYAASPLFNGNSWYSNFKNKDGVQLFNTEYDTKKWERAATAIDEAILCCENHGMCLESSIEMEATPLLNTVRNIQQSVFPQSWNSTELILGVFLSDGFDLAAKLPRYNEEHSYFNNNVLGCISPSMKMVELFYTENGLPIEMDANWNYAGRYAMGIEGDDDYKNVVAIGKDVLNLHLKREPRFYADIAFDKGIWLRGSEYVEMNPYRGGIHGTNDLILSAKSILNLSGYWIKKRVHAQNGGGPALNNMSVAPLARFRLADLYLMQAEAWNEIGIEHKEKVYNALNIIRERAGIPTVQDSWNNFSTDPNKIQNKEGLREIIRQERMIEFAFEGQRFWDLRRWKIAHRYMNEAVRGWNVFGENSEEFYNFGNGPIIVSKKNKFVSPRDYFWPIKDEEILKASIKQNLGW